MSEKTEDEIIKEEMNTFGERLSDFGKKILDRAEIFEETSEDSKQKNDNINETLGKVDDTLNKVDKSIKSTKTIEPKKTNNSKRSVEELSRMDKIFASLFPRFSKVNKEAGVLSASLQSTSDNLENVSHELDQEANPYLKYAAQGVAKAAEVGSELIQKPKEEEKPLNDNLIESVDTKSIEKKSRTSRKKSKKQPIEKLDKNKTESILLDQNQLLESMDDSLKGIRELTDKLLSKLDNNQNENVKYYEKLNESTDHLTETNQQSLIEQGIQTDISEEQESLDDLSSLTEKEKDLESKNNSFIKPNDTEPKKEEEKKSLFSGIFDSIMNIFEPIKSMFGSIFSFITPLFKFGKKLLKIGFIISAVIGAVQGLMKATEIFGPDADIWQYISSALAGIIDGLTFGLLDDIFGVGMEDIAHFFDDLGKDFGGTMMKVWEAILNVDWAGIIKSIWGKITKYIVDPLLEFGEWVFKKLGEIDWIKLGTSLGGILVDVVIGYFNMLKNIGTWIWDILKDADWSGIFKGIGNIILSGYKLIFGILKGVVSKIPFIGDLFKDGDTTKEDNNVETGLTKSIKEDNNVETGLTKSIMSFKDNQPSPFMTAPPATFLLQAEKQEMKLAILDKGVKDLKAEKDKSKTTESGDVTQINQSNSRTTNIINRPLDARNMSMKNSQINRKEY